MFNLTQNLERPLAFRLYQYTSKVFMPRGGVGII